MKYLATVYVVSHKDYYDRGIVGESKSWYDPNIKADSIQDIFREIKKKYSIDTSYEEENLITGGRHVNSQSMKTTEEDMALWEANRISLNWIDYYIRVFSPLDAEELEDYCDHQKI